MVLLPAKLLVQGITEVLATAKVKAVWVCSVPNDHNCFDLVTLVQTLHTLQTATNSIIVWLRFTLFTFSVAR